MNSQKFSYEICYSKNFGELFLNKGTSVLKPIYNWFIAWTVWVTMILNCNPKFILLKLSQIAHSGCSPGETCLVFWFLVLFWVYLTCSTLKNRWELLAKSDLQHIKWRELTRFLIYRGRSDFFSPEAWLICYAIVFWYFPFFFHFFFNIYFSNCKLFQSTANWSKLVS